MKRNITHREKSELCFLSLSYGIHLFLSARRAFWICWCHELSLGPGLFPRLGSPTIHFFSSPYICSPPQPWVPEHGPMAVWRNTGKQITGHRPSIVLNSPCLHRVHRVLVPALPALFSFPLELENWGGLVEADHQCLYLHIIQEVGEHSGFIDNVCMMVTPQVLPSAMLGKGEIWSKMLLKEVRVVRLLSSICSLLLRTVRREGRWYKVRANWGCCFRMES